MNGGRKKQLQQGRRRQRRITVRAVRRDQPDLRKLARGLLAIVAAQDEAEAQAQHERQAAEETEAES